MTLDDQSIVERMFRLDAPALGAGNLKHGWTRAQLRAACSSWAVRHPVRAAAARHRAARSRARRTRARSRASSRRRDFSGVVHARHQERPRGADAERAVRGRPRDPARRRPVLARGGRQGAHADGARRRPAPGAAACCSRWSTAARRIDDAERDLEQRLRARRRRRGWPRFQTVLSRSPRVEALNSAHRHAALDPAPRERHRDPPRAARAGRRGRASSSTSASPRWRRAGARGSRAASAQPGGRAPRRAATGLARAVSRRDSAGAISPSNTFSAGPSGQLEVCAPRFRKLPPASRPRDPRARARRTATRRRPRRRCCPTRGVAARAPRWSARMRPPIAHRA